MDISKHAKIRCQQRGIPISIVDLIMQFGTPIPKAGGAFEFRILRKDKNRVQSYLKQLTSLLNKTSDIALIESNGKILTVYQKSKRKKKRR